MATDPIHADRLADLFNDLEARKSLLTTCTNLYNTLSHHFQTLQQTLGRKSQALNSEIKAFESHTAKTLESLKQREDSIPERESAAITRLEELKQLAVLEFENPVAENGEFVDKLKSYCRRMDVNGLMRLLLSKRKESSTLRLEIAAAVEEAVDSEKLVVDAVEEFLNAKSGKQGVGDRRWTCVVLIEAVFPVREWATGRRGVARRVRERAAEVAEKWKGVLGGGEGGEVGAGEAAMFLQMVVGFGLREKFQEEFLRKLVVEHAARRDMAKIAMALGFQEKMRDIIEELVKSGKEIEAVYFAFESGLTEQFQPASLLKSYLNNSRKNVNAVLKSGKSGAAAMASNMELHSCRAIIKCVEVHKLKSEFSIDNLKKRVMQLEETRAEKKKISEAAHKPKKRIRGGAGNSRDGSGPPSKSGRYSNVPPSQPNQAQAIRYPTPYSYPSQGAYKGPGHGFGYGSGYGAIHTQSPAAVPQQYSYASQDVGTGSLTNAAAYGAQSGYGAYDYSAAKVAPHSNSHHPAYQQSYPQ